MNLVIATEKRTWRESSLTEADGGIIFCIVTHFEAD